MSKNLVDTRNIIIMPNNTLELSTLISRMKRVRSELPTGSEAYIKIDDLIRSTLRRGY